ncbi:hypothetical protein ABZP36_014507 [Zizania latifolia]
MAGRIIANPSSGLPEVHCSNQGAELVVGKADVALSRVVSFSCGGFTVTWGTDHVVMDGNALSLLVTAWSELVRSGELSAGSRPNHDRSVFRPRAPPSYSASLDKAFTPLDDENMVNVLASVHSFVVRMYYIGTSDIARLREAASRDGAPATRVQAVSRKDKLFR